MTTRSLARATVCALLLSSLGLLTGCSSTPPTDLWAHLDADGLLGLGVTEAAADEDGLLLHFEATFDHQVPSQTLTGSVAWGATLDEGPVLAADAVRNAAVEIIDAETYRTRRDAGRPIQVLSALHWQSLRQAVLTALAPEDPGGAFVLRLGDRDEWILCNDDSGNIGLLPIEDLPADLALSESPTSREVIDAIHETLDRELAKLDIESREVVINTGDTNPAGFASVYVHLDDDLAVLHRVASAGGAGSRAFSRTAKSANRVVVQGHVVEIVTHPVSTIYRLLHSVGFAVSDLATPTDSRRMTMMSAGEVPLANEPPMDLEAFDERLDSLTGTETHPGKLRFLVGGDAFFPRLYEALVEARTSIDMRMFIFKNDDIAVRVADLLRRQSEELKVRVLLDGVGTLMGIVDEHEALPHGFVPPLSIVDHLESDSRVRVRVRTPAFLRADHTKTTIIDDETCFLGGMNIGREYRFDWHDLMVEVNGPVVQHIREQFLAAWVLAGWSGDFGYFFWRIFHRSPKERDGGPDHIPIRVLRTRASSSEIYNAQLAAIRAARQRIVIENAYFADDEILTELIAARQRGVDVRVILPVEGNHGIMNANNLVMTNVMTRYGIRVFLYPGMSHVKAAIYDGWACLGSANFDRLSLRRNQELNIAFSDPDAVQALWEAIFEPDLARSHEVTEPFDTSWSDHLNGILAGML